MVQEAPPCEVVPSGQPYIWAPATSGHPRTGSNASVETLALKMRDMGVADGRRLIRIDLADRIVSQRKGFSVAYSP
jgi:hypothetical protein